MRTPVRATFEDTPHAQHEDNPTGQVTIPRARPNPADIRHREPAGALYRAMRERAERGLAWRECWMVLEEAGHEDAQVGPTIIWMRSKGVGVIALYENGETIFVLEEVGAKERESLAVTEGSD